MYTENQNQFPENQPSFNQPNIPPNVPPNMPMGQMPLPNASTVLILGIVSIVISCCCYGILGIVLAIVTLVMAKKAREIYYANPNAYTPGSLSNITTGRICAIIAIVIGIIVIVSYIIIISMYGMSSLTNPQELQEILRRRM